MMEYHHQIRLELACGCKVEGYYQLGDGIEPCGESAYVALIDTVTQPAVALLCAEDTHDQRGNESLTVTVRTKVGPVPPAPPDAGALPYL